MIRLDIGPENTPPRDNPKASSHVIDLKNVDASSKKKAHERVTVDLKKEIEFKNSSPEKIHIVGKNFSRRRGLGRIPMLVAALFMILALNVGQMIFLGKNQGEEALALAAEGFMSLKGASQSFVSGESGADLLMFDQAQQLFDEAKNKGAFLLTAASPWLDEPGPVQSLSNVLDAGSLMAEVGKHLSSARSSLTQLPPEGSLTDYLRTVSEADLEPAAEQMNQIQTLLENVDLSGTEYQAQFSEYEDKLSALSDLLNLWVSVKEPLLIALGDKTPQTYLVLLQNNDEMRLGGGFIGSFVLVTLNDGRLSPLDFHDVYEFDNRSYQDIPVPIPELTGLTTQWRLRDSNYSPDFPTSAQKSAWFLEQEGGPGVDGVIAVNLSAAQAFMEDTGALTLPSLSKALSAETFPAVLSTLVEAKTFGKTTPKAVLGELLNAFMEKASNPQTAAALGGTAWEQIQKKQLLFYHKDPRVEKLFTDLGMEGSIPKLSTLEGDFYMPTVETISGNKTERYIQTKLTHDTEILEDGSMVATVGLTRTHTFNDDTLAWLKQTTREYGFTAWTGTLEALMGNAPNKAAIRLYLPEGATLLDSSGIYRDDVRIFYDSDQDLSYYYFDQTLLPGESQTITLQFALPLKLQGSFQNYNFQWFKQPGLKNVTYEESVTAETRTLLSSSPVPTEIQPGRDYFVSGSFDQDLSLNLLYQ
jgi:hypothetical protein